jgi:hypothetical protein
MDWILDNRVVLINIAYLIAAVCFIVGLKLLSSPATARRGNQIAALGMAIAVVATLFMPGLQNIWLIVIGLAIGAAVATFPARSVKMTAIVIPNAAIWLPRRAVAGELRSLRPTMKQTAAMRYAILISTIRLSRIQSITCLPPRRSSLRRVSA